jgi:hypothetical protein
MALFGGLFGSKRHEDERAHHRAPGHGVRVQIDRHVYQVQDLSPGGFRLFPYDGDLIARQNFAFRFHVVLHGESYDIPCHGYVVRIDEKGLAARYQRPQPYYQHILSEYLRATAHG